MTDKRIQLSRRKLLAGLGSVGLASAGAGMGTTALFSDEESFENNSLAAGELDLKVDWEEHYFGGPNENGSSEATIVGGNPNPNDVDYYLPATDTPDADPVALNFVNDQDALWDATAIEAFPDGDNDGLQDGSVSCSDLLSVDDALTSDKRTENGYTASGDPLVKLQDVKPGDFGEVTFSFHICDNPGYVWMQGDLVSADENGVTEPEGDDPQEDGADSTDPADVELLDVVRTRMWYDQNCDNQLETADEIDVMMVVDDSISSDDADQGFLEDGLTEFVGGLSSDSRVGLLTFGDGSVGNVFQSLDTPGNLDLSGVPETGGSGNTPLPAALDIADQAVRNDANARSSAEKVIVAFTDGGPNYDENSTYSANGYTAPRNSSFPPGGYDGGGGGSDAQGRPGGISDSELRETAEVAELVRDGGTRIITVNIDVAGQATDPVLDLPSYLRNEIASSQAYAKDVQLDDLAAVANDLAAVTTNEDLFFEGSLREALDALSSGKGIPLDGDTSTPFNEFSGSLPDVDDDGTDEFTADITDGEDRDEFPGAGSTHCVGFEWWLPIDHANQIQSDSAQFDLGFYTEQSRHNETPS